MKVRTLLSAVIATGLLLSVGAQATDRGHGDRDDYRQHERHDYRQVERYHDGWNRVDRRHYEVRNYGRYYYEGPHYSARSYPYWPAYYPRHAYYYGNPYGYGGTHGTLSVNLPLF